jgi:hypothetical protein
MHAGIGGSAPDDHPFPLSLILAAAAEASGGAKPMLAAAHGLQAEAKALHLRSALLLTPAPVGPATPSTRSRRTLPLHFLSAASLPPPPPQAHAASAPLLVCDQHRPNQVKRICYA